jgi:hypothetical protein
MALSYCGRSSIGLRHSLPKPGWIPHWAPSVLSSSPMTHMDMHTTSFVIPPPSHLENSLQVSFYSTLKASLDDSSSPLGKPLECHPLLYKGPSHTSPGWGNLSNSILAHAFEQVTPPRKSFTGTPHHPDRLFSSLLLCNRAIVLSHIKLDSDLLPAAGLTVPDAQVMLGLVPDDCFNYHAPRGSCSSQGCCRQHNPRPITPANAQQLLSRQASASLDQCPSLGCLPPCNHASWPTLTSGSVSCLASSPTVYTCLHIFFPLTSPPSLTESLPPPSHPPPTTLHQHSPHNPTSIPLLHATFTSPTFIPPDNPIMSPLPGSYAIPFNESNPETLTGAQSKFPSPRVPQ